MSIRTALVQTFEAEYNKRKVNNIVDGSLYLTDHYFVDFQYATKDSPWCAAFVYWCIKQACYGLCMFKYLKSIYCPEIYKWASNNAFIRPTGQKPEPGDVFLRLDSQYQGFEQAGHTGFVYKVFDKTWVSLEGNSKENPKQPKDSISKITRAFDSATNFVFINMDNVFIDIKISDQLTEQLKDTPYTYARKIYDYVKDSGNKEYLSLINKFFNHPEIKTVLDKYRVSSNPNIVTEVDYFAKILNFTLEIEGGYVNNPSDPGGETNKGIRQVTYDSYRKENKQDLKSVKFITDTEVIDIYKKYYWLQSKCQLLPAPLNMVLFDTAVNFGCGGAVMFLQEALGLKDKDVDGILGSNTLSLITPTNATVKALSIINGRISYRYDIVKKYPERRIFLEGWIKRDNNLKKFILTP